MHDQEIRRCSPEQLLKSWELILDEEPKPMDPKWVNKKVKEIRLGLRLNDERSRALLVRSMLAADFCLRNKVELKEKNVLDYSDETLEMTWSKLLVVVLARVPAYGNQNHLDDKAVFFAIDRMTALADQSQVVEK